MAPTSRVCALLSAIVVANFAHYAQGQDNFNFRVTLFEDKNYKGGQIIRAISTCSNLPVNFARKVRSLRTPFRCVMLYPERSCRGKPIRVRRNTADLGNFNGRTVSISPCGDYSLWPRTLTENWLHLRSSVNHDNMQVRQTFRNDQVAIYIENMPRGSNWMNDLLTRVWKHVKSTYGISADGERGMLGVIFHAGSTANHSAESSHLNWWFGNRNTIHLMRTNAEAFSQTYENSTEPSNLDDLDDLIDSLGWIVRTSAFNIEGQAGNQIFKFDAWSDIFRHDIYTMLGREDLVLRNKEKVRGRVSSSSWVSANLFDDWFLPIYTKYGGSKVLGRFFKILSENFSREFRDKEGHESYNDRFLWVSEFVHFWSGAAGTNLKLLALTAFGNVDMRPWEQHFESAQKAYSNIQYSQDFVEVEMFEYQDYSGYSMRRVVPSCVTLPWYMLYTNSLKLGFGSNCVALFSEVGCTGDSVRVDKDYKNLGRWKNKTKSISVCGSKWDDIYRDYLVKSGGTVAPYHDGRLVQLAHSDDDVVFYFDKIQTGTNWMFGLMSDAWKHVKANFGRRHTGKRSKLTVVLSAGADTDFAVSKWYLDSNSAFKDLIERTYRDPLAFAQSEVSSTSPMNLDYAHALMDSASWIVLNSAYGVNGTWAPAAHVTGRYSFCLIFRHDVYTKLRRQDLLEHNMKIAERVQSWSPAGDVYWFRDWYLPIYEEFGGTEVLKRFLKLQADEWPKNDDKSYRGEMSLGDFVHYWSGAAGRDLAPMAREMFQWKNEHEDQLRNAKRNHRRISY